jgi:hypothetical protein
VCPVAGEKWLFWHSATLTFAQRGRETILGENASPPLRECPKLKTRCASNTRSGVLPRARETALLDITRATWIWRLVIRNGVETEAIKERNLGKYFIFCESLSVQYTFVGGNEKDENSYGLAKLDSVPNLSSSPKLLVLQSHI